MGAWEHHLLEFAYFLEYNIQSHLKLLSLSLLGKAPGLLFQIDYQEVKVRMKLAGLKVLRGLPEVSEGFEIENILEELYPNPKQESELRYPLRGAQQLDTWQYMPSYTFFDDIYERIMNETYAREKGFKSLVTLERRVQALVEIARQVREAREAMAPLL